MLKKLIAPLVLFLVVAYSATLIFTSPASAQTNPNFSQETFPSSINQNSCVFTSSTDLWCVESSGKIAKVTTTGDITEYPIPSNLLNAALGPVAIAKGLNSVTWLVAFNIATSSGATAQLATDGTVSNIRTFSIGTDNVNLFGLTIGPDGNLWATTSTNSGGLILKLSSDGQVTKYPVVVDGGNVAGLTSGLDGNVWFYGLDSLGKITPSGSVTVYPLPSSYNPLWIMHSVTRGLDGNMWFTAKDSSNIPYIIGKITPNGSYTIYPVPENCDQVNFLTTGPSGNLWFLETPYPSYGCPPDTNNYLGEITSSGQYSKYQIPSQYDVVGSDSTYPTGQALTDPDGNLWLTDTTGIVQVNLPGSPSHTPPAAHAYLVSHTTSPSSRNTATNGEPINMIGGNYLLTRHDFNVPGRDLPVNFYLSYNSNAASQNSPVGFGWTHSYLVSVLPESDGSVIVNNEDGRMDQYTPDGSGGYTPPPDIHDSLTKTTNAWRLIRKNHDTLNFNNNGQLTSIISPNGNSQTLTYNSQNELTTLTDTVGRNFSFSYDNGGQLTKVTDPSGRTVSYSYDSNGDLVTATDPNGGVTKYAYDTDHHITSITDPRGNTAITNTYDSEGRVVTQKNALGAEVSLAYTPGQTTFTDAKGNKTTYSYDDQLRLTKVQNANGGATTYTYDADGNQNTITDPKGNKTSLIYDSNSNLIQKTDANGGITKYTYDANNNLTSTTDPLGHTTSYAYDSQDNVTGQTNTAGGKTIYAYDSNGDLTSITDPASAVTKLGYDSRGDATSVTDPLDHVSHIAYDSIGRPIAATNATGQTTKYVYDALDHLLQTKDPLGDTTIYAYDADGNQTKVTDPDSHATSYVYNAANELAQVVDALGHKTTYAYDADGNMTSSTDANSHKTTYSYDVLSQLVSTTNPLSQKTTQTYDPDGNVVSSTDPKSQTTTYGYNPLGQLTKTTYADNTSVAYTYDANGNRTQMTDSTGRTTYAYDVLGNLVKVTSPGNKAIAYTYNPDSEQTSLIYPDGRVEGYVYNPAGELTTAIDWNHQSTNYTYDANGNPTQASYPNGAGITYAYDNADRLTNVTDTPKYGLGTSYTYTLDAAGNRTGVTQSLDLSVVIPPFRNDDQGRELSGKLDFRNLGVGLMGSRQYSTPVLGWTTNYSYDALNRLVGVKGVDTNQTFTYDPVGNRLTQTNYGRSTNYTYNAGDELLGAGDTSYTYDANGNRIQQKDGGRVTNYTYNDTNELTSVADRSRTLEQYIYNGDGDRVQTTAGHSTTNDVWNVNGSLPQVLTQTTDNHTIDYQYGNSLISSDRQNSDNQSYYEYDGLGSVVGTTNIWGATTSQDAYSAYGNTLYGSDTDGSQSAFGYAGQQEDGTGLIYMRARYYDPNTGTFLTKDTYSATAATPMTLDRYLYVGDNPVNLVDPLGLWGWNPLSDIRQAAVSSWQFTVRNRETIGATTGIVITVVASTACIVSSGGVATPACLILSGIVGEEANQLISGKLNPWNLATSSTYGKVGTAFTFLNPILEPQHAGENWTYPPASAPKSTC